MNLSDSNLRRRLGEITKQDISDHNRLLEELQGEIEHSVSEVLLNANDLSITTDYNCFEFALGLVYSDSYELVLAHQRGWKITPVGGDKVFAKYLLENQKLNEIDFENIKDGDLVIYFDSQEPVHAGEVTDNRIISKWGKGLLLSHEIAEAPDSYGSEVKFYEAIDANNLDDYFTSFAEENGIQFEDAPKE